jgi:eukaryotic-like serine/threonine-protein kinase
MPGLEPELWRRVSPHLERILEMPAPARASYVAALRQSEADVARELEALLAAHEAAAAEGFLERAPVHPMIDSLRPGQLLGAYSLLSEIGRGGMGSVWLAARVDGLFQRRVAVKFLNPSLVGRAGEERFRREGGLLAQLTHPNIARLIDAGVTSAGQPFLVIEHVDGESIDRYCDAHKLGIEERLRLFFDVLAAVADAHSRLIVHRDLKPSNVLVTNDGQVKLLDFGIAKLLDGREPDAAETRLTRVGGWALTPEYAAPEQVTGAPISTATDVYALGVMLYELLSGRHAVTVPVHAPLDLVKAVVDTVPRHMADVALTGPDAGASEAIAKRRSTTAERLKASLRGDLDTIVGKAMKKDPVERYPSVASLAEDLRRYLRHDPIAARPDTAAYRAQKFIRRNRTGVALAGLALLAAFAGVVATLYQARAARDERDNAIRQLTRAESLNDLNHFLLSEAAPLGRPLEVDELLQRAEQIARRQSAGGVESRVNLLLSVGDQYTTLDKSDKAKSVLELAYADAHATDDPSLRARTACGLAQALAKGDGLARAKVLATEGLAELPDRRKFVLDRIYCLQKASYVAREDGSAATAIARIDEARRLLAQSPYRSEIQDLAILMDVAESYSQAGRHADAAPAFERAAAVMAALGRDQTQQAGTLYNNWALSLDLSGRPRDAEPIFRRAIEVSRVDASDSAVSPMLLVNYGRTLRQIGRMDESARFAEEGYGRAKSTGFEVVVNQSLLLRAAVYREQGDLARAGAMLREVEPRLREALPPGHPGFGGFLIERALVAQANGDSAGALGFIDQAYEIAEASRRAEGVLTYIPRVLNRRAEIRNAAGRNAAAESDARLSLVTLEEILPHDALSVLRGDAYASLGRALMAEGRPGEGKLALREALRQLTSALGPDHPRTREVQSVLEGVG